MFLTDTALFLIFSIILLLLLIIGRLCWCVVALRDLNNDLTVKNEHESHLVGEGLIKRYNMYYDLIKLRDSNINRAQQLERMGKE